MKKIFLEVIAKDLEDIKVINKTNADRIEFCHDLEVGGLTPDIKSIKKASEISEKPLMIMLRRHHNTFEITEEQVNELINIIKKIDKYDFTGYVFGAIKEKNIDEQALKKISNALDEVNSKKIITFHKAFDYVEDKAKSLKFIAKYSRVKTILTSGGIGDPLNNIETIKKLKNENIRILIGGGVNKENLTKLLNDGVNSIHIGTAARKLKSWDSKILEKNISTFK